MNELKDKVSYYLNGTVPEIHLNYLVETEGMLIDIP